jgi:hypothetical protein
MGLAAGPTLCVGAAASASEWVRMGASAHHVAVDRGRESATVS